MEVNKIKEKLLPNNIAFISGNTPGMNNKQLKSTLPNINLNIIDNGN